MKIMKRELFIGVLVRFLCVSASHFVIYKLQLNQYVAYFKDVSPLIYKTESLPTEKTSKSPIMTNSQASLSTSTIHKHSGVPDQETIYNRIDNVPEKTKTLPFLKNFKNPCWREADVNNSCKTRCLPFFYSVGPLKCGTTDLHRRLTRHPQISSTVQKEIQWLSRQRFDHPKASNLSKYLTFFDEAVSTDIIPSGRNGYHDAIIGDFSPTTICNNWHYVNSSFPNFTSNADVIHHLNPDAKILVTLRNPATRCYSQYKHFNPAPSPKLFHSEIVRSIEAFDHHCNNTNVRHCINTVQNVKRSMLIGIYYVYIEDYLRLFPRQQIFITKVEERSKNMTSALKEIFSFLDIDPLPDALIEDIASQDIVSKDTHGVTDMLEETKILLENFFKPFNERLGNLVGPEFNFNLYK